MMKVGDTVSRRVYFGHEFSQEPLTGTVVYIHPQRRFYTVEFTCARGRKFREAYILRARITSPLYAEPRGETWQTLPGPRGKYFPDGREKSKNKKESKL